MNDFIDTWDLYRIGSNTVNLSEQAAEDIAMTNAKTHSWTVGSGNETAVIKIIFHCIEPMVKTGAYYVKLVMRLMREALIR